MATAVYGGYKPPVILEMSENEARSLMLDLDEAPDICEQSERIRNALRNLLED